MKQNHIYLIYGATASGKSQLAITLASELKTKNQEPIIINADALQQYKDLPILSAQPSTKIKQQFPHELYGFLKPHDHSDVYSWLKQVTTSLTTHLANHKTPILVGGTGLYFSSFLYGLSPMPKIALTTKQHWQQQLKKLGLPALFEELKKLDSKAYETLKPNDQSRILRALIVSSSSDKPYSYWRAQPKQDGCFQLFPNIKTLFYYCQLDKTILTKRILHRWQNMLEQGVIVESQKLLNKYPIKEFDKTNLPILKTLGANIIRQHLTNKNVTPLSTVTTSITTETLQYAKRQRTWARGQLPKPDKIITIVQ